MIAAGAGVCPVVEAVCGVAAAVVVGAFGLAAAGLLPANKVVDQT